MIDDHAPPAHDPDASSEEIIEPRSEGEASGGDVTGGDGGDHGLIAEDLTASDTPEQAESVRCRPRESNRRQENQSKISSDQPTPTEEPPPFPSPGTICLFATAR